MKFSKISSPRDFWAGAFYLGLGLAALWIGRDYPFGTLVRLGSGAFPKMIGWLLVLVGLVSLARGCLAEGPRITPIAWRPLLVITASVVMSAWILLRAGLVLTLVILILGSATAMRDFRLSPGFFLFAVLFAAACALVFVRSLGVPMPIFPALPF